MSWLILFEKSEEREEKCTNPSFSINHLDRSSRRRTYIREMDDGYVGRQHWHQLNGNCTLFKKKSYYDQLGQVELSIFASGFDDLSRRKDNGL